MQKQRCGETKHKAQQTSVASGRTSWKSLRAKDVPGPPTKSGRTCAKRREVIRTSRSMSICVTVDAEVTNDGVRVISDRGAIESRIVVDTTGRKRWLARRLGLEDGNVLSPTHSALRIQVRRLP